MLYFLVLVVSLVVR